MEHVAIDLGGRESQICVRSEDGAIVEERRVSTRSLGRYLKGRAKSRVILESCTEAFGVADRALEHGHEVRVVAGKLVRSLGVGDRGIKTDVRDARTLSEVSCRINLPSVHIPSKVSRRRKTLCGMRESLVAARTQLVNCVRGWMRAQALGIRRGTPETFPDRVHAASTELPQYVSRLLETVSHLTGQIRAADKELKTLANEDPLIQRLMTVPGVGIVTAVRFVAAIDDVSRFANAHELESYLGLVPGEQSSSNRKHRTSITKAGPSDVRRVLVLSAWAARRQKLAPPIVLWALEVEKRRGKKIATVALARKLAGIMYAVWRDGTTYDACHGYKRAVR